MKTSSILSAAITLFSVFAAASPVASSKDLVARDDSAGAGIITALTNCRSDLTVCHNKYKTKCQNTCSQGDIGLWGDELASIVDKCTIAVKTATPAGFKFIDPTPCISIISAIICDINGVLAFLLGKCGLIGWIWTLLGLLLSNLETAILALLAVLAFVVDGLIPLIVVVLQGLLSGSFCYCCGLFGIHL